MRLRLGRVDQAQVHATGGQPFGNIHGKAFTHGQLGLGHFPVKRVNQGQRQPPRQAGRQTHHDASHRLVAMAAQVFLGQGHALHDGVAMLQQPAAGIRERHATACADQQGFAQLSLQRPHLSAQGRLGNVQKHGCLAETAGLGHAYKGFNLLEVHELRVCTHLVCIFSIAARQWPH